MKLLITGICGFVGSTIAARLRQSTSAVDIIGIDNLSRNGSWRNREKLTEMGVPVIHGDIRNTTDIEAVGPVDWVVDAAANASVLAGVDGKSSTRQLVDNNLAGTINLLEHCRCHGAGFILLSTSRVYSIPPLAQLPVNTRGAAYSVTGTMLPQGVTEKGISESFSTEPPISLYGATKRSSEQLALEYGLTFDFPVYINRCGVMAGAGQFGKADQGIFSFWLHSWKEKQPLRYIGFGGNGYQVRDCLHPADLVSLLARQFDCGDKAMPTTVNISGGISSATSLAELSLWCEQRWGTHEVVSDTKERPFDLPWVVLDHQLATTAWGWEPETSVQEILSEIAEFADTQTDWIRCSR